MAVKYVAIVDASAVPMRLSCGHDTRSNGWPDFVDRADRAPHTGDPWACELCGAGIQAALDQELAAATEVARAGRGA
jgi:hypothetical protein